MKVQWITHKGKKILFSDYSNVKSQTEMISILDEYLKQIRSSSGKVLVFSDVSDAATGPDFMKKAKEEGKSLIERTDKSAIMGITGLKGMLLKGYNLFSGDKMKPFSTKEEALDYLVS